MRSFPQPRSYKKNEMLYPDRCMLKYHGFLLSDHDEALREDRKEAYGYEEHWDELIKDSLIHSLPIIITTSEDTLVGPILSLKDESFLLKVEGDFHVIRRESVLSIEALNALSDYDSTTIDRGSDSFIKESEEELVENREDKKETISPGDAYDYNQEPLDFFSFIREEEKKESLEDKPLSFDWDPWSVDL